MENVINITNRIKHSSAMAAE